MPSLSITGALVMLDEGPRQLALRIVDGVIAAIGGSPQRGDAVLNLLGYAVFPGLINSHDHLALNVFPRIKLRQVYDNAHQWRRDFEAQLEAPGIQRLHAAPMDDRLFLGGIKNLLSGATTVAHHGALYRPLRSRRFPIRVARPYGWADGLDEEGAVLLSFDSTSPEAPWAIPVAEGTDSIASAELRRLDELGCLAPNTVLVHGVGLSQSDLARVKEVGAGLIWCPESNLFLLGQAQFHEVLLGRMALGTDSRLTGSRDLLEELKLAARLSRLPARRLLSLVLGEAVSVLRMDSVGRISLGFHADLVMVRCTEENPYQVLMEAHRADLQMVMVAGQPCIADSDMEEAFQSTRTPAELVWLGRTNLEEPGLVVG
jgi:cytosine/adenosine deaminase-related metal-dependent hydrolase